MSEADSERRLTVTRGGLFRTAAVFSLAGLLAVVALVGVVGVVAQYFNTWTWFFRMEQLASVSAPVALGLLGLTITCWLGVVYEAKGS